MIINTCTMVINFLATLAVPWPAVSPLVMAGIAGFMFCLCTLLIFRGNFGDFFRGVFALCGSIVFMASAARIL